jgi:hypothetical protein
MNSKGCSNGPVLRLSQIRTEKARRSLKEFVLQAWPVRPSSMILICAMNPHAFM